MTFNMNQYQKPHKQEKLSSEGSVQIHRKQSMAKPETRLKNFLHKSAWLVLPYRSILFIGGRIKTQIRDPEMKKVPTPQIIASTLLLSPTNWLNFQLIRTIVSTRQKINPSFESYAKIKK